MDGSKTEQQWTSNYANSMRVRAAHWEATRGIAQDRSRAQSQVARVNRAKGLAERRCVVKGCAFVWHKGKLCRKHWALVPYEEKMELMFATLEAQRRTADKHHRQIERRLVTRLKAALEREAVSPLSETAA